MELNQRIFKGLHKFYKRITSKTDEELETRSVQLEPLKPRLTILSRALTGCQNEIITSEREGGWSGLKFYLPASVSFLESIDENINFYVFRVLYLSVQQKMRLNWEDNDEHKTIESQERAFGFSQDVLAELFSEYPGTEEIYATIKSGLEKFYLEREKTCDYSWLYGRSMKLNRHEFEAETDAPKQKGKKLHPSEITTELEANPSDDVTTIGIDKKTDGRQCCQQQL